jgi:hypothetical protein
MSVSPRPKIPNVSQHGFSSFRTDLFGRIKVSEPFTLFDSSHRYFQNGEFSDITANGGNVTYNVNQSTELLNVTTTSGSKVYRESKKVFPYQPGKSLQVMQTFCFAPAQANLRQRVGYFSSENGVYLEQEGTSVYLVKRSYISGSVVNTRVAQADWNIDPLNGSGPSDIVLDLTKVQILWSEYEWLGVGSVRIGFAIDGFFIPVHAFHHANHIDTVYMTTASLPVRYEIENTGATAANSTMKQICVSVISNGGFARQTERWTTSTPSAVTAGTTFVPLTSLRMVSGRTDSVIIPAGIGILPTGSANIEWALFRNATLTGATTWTTHPVSTNVEYNTNATALSGGVTVRQGFFAGSNQSTGSVDIYEGLNTFDLQLGRTISDTPVSDVLTLAVRTLSGSTGVFGSLSWFDLL